MLSEPHWLLLLIPLFWLAYTFRPESKKLLALRIGLVAVLCLALAGPSIKISGKEGVVVVVADRSASMPKNQDKRIEETVSFLREKMPENSRLGLVSFSDKAKIEFSPTKNEASALSVEQHPDSSNLADGIDLALSLIPEKMSGRIVVISDGLWNGNAPQEAAMLALNRGIPIDYRYNGREIISDLAVAYLRVPPVLEPKEPFIMKAGIVTPNAQEVDLQLSDGKKVIFSAKKYLKQGMNEFFFNLYAPSNGISKYIMKVTGAVEDSVPENNTAQAVSMVKGMKPVLVVTESVKSTMSGFLAKNKVKSVEMLAKDFSWAIEDLAGYSAVVLENVSANNLGFNGLHNLAAWVRHMGGGLLVTGGKNSYGTGGYYQSPLEEALPVSLEMRSECRKMSIAIAVVLDRSGSMSMQVKGRTKMELADLAAASSLDLLAPMDEFALFAVDTEPHVVVPLQSVSDKDKWRDDILRVKSTGGGIYVYEGVNAAVEMLKHAKAKTRHIILFADACDSEKPGTYWELLDDAQKHNMTLSVIGLGKETDPDGHLLTKIAAAGKGRCFFTEEAEDLPRLFSQDTFMAAKSTFVDEKQNIKPSLGLQTYTGYDKSFSSSVGGYNICYLKPEASQIITADDDDKSPILAAWQYGLGHVACYTGVLDEEFGGAFLKTEAAGQILSGITSWIAFDDRDSLDQLMVTQKIENGKWSAYLNLDPERVRDPFTNTPTFEIIGSDNIGEPVHYSLKANWESADKLSASYQLHGKEVITALLSTDDNQQLRLAPACQIYSPEFMPQTNRNGGNELKKLANTTGGKELIDLNSVWETMPSVYQERDISNYLFVLALFLFLLEVAERRTAILTIIVARLRKIVSGSKVEKAVAELSPVEVKDTGSKTLKEAAPLISNKPEAVISTPQETKEKANVLSALKAAKKNADRRTGKD